MGRHPSRDEIASADYWGASVWVSGTGRGDEGVHVEWDWWLPLCLGSRGASEADRLFPQSALLQPPLTRRLARRQAGREAGKREMCWTEAQKKTSLQKKAEIHHFYRCKESDETCENGGEFILRHQKCKERRCQKSYFCSWILVGVKQKIYGLPSPLSANSVLTSKNNKTPI